MLRDFGTSAEFFVYQRLKILKFQIDQSEYSEDEKKHMEVGRIFPVACDFFSLKIFAIHQRKMTALDPPLIQPSNVIQNHKSKKDFKFNFVLISENTTLKKTYSIRLIAAPLTLE